MHKFWDLLSKDNMIVNPKIGITEKLINISIISSVF